MIPVMRHLHPRPAPFAPVVFARPLPLAALALLVVNDHVLKGAGLLPGWVTGKLSDVAGLFFFPVLLAYLGGRVFAQRRRVAQISVLCTGVVFAALKVSPWAAAVASRWWGAVVCDRSDLLALPALWLAYSYLRRGRAAAAPAGSPWFHRSAVLAAAWASIATSPAPRPPFVAWQVRGVAEHRAGCARVTVWVAKSGKSGVGVGVARVDGTGEAAACRLTIERATLEVAGRRIAASVAPGSPLGVRDAYLPFSFDNEGAWNAGEREGTLVLELSASGERVTVRLPLLQAWQRNDPAPAPAPSQPQPPQPTPGPLFVPANPGEDPPTEEAP